MRVLLAVLALLICVPAQARMVLVSWTLPSSFEDGSPLNPDVDLAEVRVYVDSAVAAVVAGSATSAALDLSSGVYEITATVVSTPESAGEGSESILSRCCASKPRPRWRCRSIVLTGRKIPHTNPIAFDNDENTRPVGGR